MANTFEPDWKEHYDRLENDLANAVDDAGICSTAWDTDDFYAADMVRDCFTFFNDQIALMRLGWDVVQKDNFEFAAKHPTSPLVSQIDDETTEWMVWKEIKYAVEAETKAEAPR